ncbi:MAG: metal ABC transporter substrate-binding protein [Candidatus Gracilibacteria bacterium]
MKNFRSLFCAVVLLLAVSCTSQTSISENNSGAKLQVVTTFAPLYSMTVNVAGEYADVKNLVPIGSSEHTYQARPSDIALLSKADLVIKNGVNLEGFLDPLLQSSEHEGRTIIDTSSGVTLLTGLDEEETSGDPHIWLSISNAVIQVKNIESALSLKDPAHADRYKFNAETYITRLNTLEASLKNQMSSTTKRPYILFHDGFQYFEKEFDLKSSGVVEEFPGKEPSVEYMKNLYDTIEQEKVKVAFTEPQFSPKIIDQLQKRFNLVTAELDTVGTTLSKESYERLMMNNIESFLNAFSKA